MKQNSIIIFIVGAAIGFVFVWYFIEKGWQPRRLVSISEQVQEVLDRRKKDGSDSLSEKDKSIRTAWVLKRNVVEGLIYSGTFFALLTLAFLFRRNLWSSFFLGMSIWPFFASLGRFADLYGTGFLSSSGFHIVAGIFLSIILAGAITVMYGINAALKNR